MQRAVPVITVYEPKIQVILTKLVDRTDGVAFRYSKAHRQYDLTPFLGDAGAVRTMKTIATPAGGFSISFSDRVNKDIQDSVYSLIEPMDMIEIRGARRPELYPTDTLPLLMRGFVSSIRRTEGMGQDGSPQRLVIIQGQDTGKLCLINSVYFQIAMITDNAYLSQFHMQVATGIDVAVLPVSDFMRQIVGKVMNPKIQQMSAFGDQYIQPFTVDASVPDGQVLPQRAANFDNAPIWQLVEMFADRPWNEVFIQDQEDGPHFVFRPAPYKDINGQFIMNGAADPGTVALDIDAVVSLDMTRSDARVANFFWVPPGQGQIDTNLSLNVASLLKGEPLDFQYSNNAPELYGVRKMAVSTALLPNSIQNAPSMLPPDQQHSATGVVLQWYQARARQLKLMNRDNSVFEEGTALVRGDESLVPGKYLRLTRGELVSESYIVSVAHTFTPMGAGWTSTLSLERGTGFLVRNQFVGSPMWAEGRKGPYS